MSAVPTELLLRDWRFGQVQSERLCAALLSAEGFTAIDPQCPLGGPDGRKDIVCYKNDEKVVAACYFPPTHQDFRNVRDKFLRDFEGVAANNAAGFAFFVNQPVTPSERADLIGLTNVSLVEIFHLERMRAILDSPKGYGIRLEHLRIPMNEAEQLTFWSSMNSAVSDKFVTYEAGVQELQKKLDLVLARTNAMHVDLLRAPSSVGSTYGLVSSFPSEQLSISLVMWLHKLAIDQDELGGQRSGELRGVQVWIGGSGSTPETASHLPPPPDDVPRMLEELLFEWRVGYKIWATRSFDERLSAIAQFHHRFLSIHPFLDANGRVARYILEQQTLELLGKRVSQDFISDPNDYYRFLRSADTGDLAPLVELLRGSLEAG